MIAAVPLLGRVLPRFCRLLLLVIVLDQATNCGVSLRTHFTRDFDEISEAGGASADQLLALGYRFRVLDYNNDE